jgi:malonyl-CoA/methylmalonyl-CoA synthetase
MRDLVAAFPSVPFIELEKALQADAGSDLPAVDDLRNAMMLYTSGTTGKPKGVVMTHANLRAQVECLVRAWEWSPQDHTVHVLPLHHTHGIVNVLCCALWSGASLEMLPRFDANAVWDSFKKGVTLFMAVPTIYSKLIQSFDAVGDSEKVERTNACKRMRLMVSGSAALPVSIFERWKGISGHALLERYGMTEIGMALSNPVRGERRPGTVGLPLPGVKVRLVDEAGNVIHESETPGEIQIQGPAVFREYWQRPDATRESFSAEGWFKTGDVASRSADGYFRILGRTSTDIIKTGGYKVSALEIEEALREHPRIKDCAVVAVPDVEWGEKVAVAVVPSGGAPLDPKALTEWAKERLAKYKVPTLWKIVPGLPRNAMGKVIKADVRKLF